MRIQRTLYFMIGGLLGVLIVLFFSTSLEARVSDSHSFRACMKSGSGSGAATGQGNCGLVLVTNLEAGSDHMNWGTNSSSGNFLWVSSTGAGQGTISWGPIIHTTPEHGAGDHAEFSASVSASNTSNDGKFTANSASPVQVITKDHGGHTDTYNLFATRRFIPGGTGSGTYNTEFYAIMHHKGNAPPVVEITGTSVTGSYEYDSPTSDFTETGDAYITFDPGTYSVTATGSGAGAFSGDLTINSLNITFQMENGAPIFDGTNGFLSLSDPNNIGSLLTANIVGVYNFDTMPGVGLDNFMLKLEMVSAIGVFDLQDAYWDSLTLNSSVINFEQADALGGGPFFFGAGDVSFELSAEAAAPVPEIPGFALGPLALVLIGSLVFLRRRMSVSKQLVDLTRIRV